MSSSELALIAGVVGVLAVVFILFAIGIENETLGFFLFLCGVPLVLGTVALGILSLHVRNDNHKQTMKQSLEQHGFVNVYIKKVTEPTTAYFGLPDAPRGCRLKAVRIGGLWQLNTPMDTYQSVSDAKDLATWPSVERWCSLQKK